MQLLNILCKLAHNIMSRSGPNMYNETKKVFWIVLKNDFDNFDDILQVK